MRGRSAASRIALAAIAAIITLAAPAGAQPRRALSPEYDTVFRVGAHTVPGQPSFARDTLQLDFTYHYQPTWDNLGVGVLAARIAAPATIEERLDSMLYVQDNLPRGEGLQTIFIPSVLKEMASALSVADNYAYHNTDLQMFTYGAQFGELNTFKVANDATLFRTISLPADSAGLLVGAPRYVSMWGFRLSDAARYIDPTKYPFYDIGRGDSVAGLDSSFMVRLGLHFKVEANDTVPLSTIIANVKIWRRIYAGQGPGDNDCRCGIYALHDSVDISYGRYDSSNRVREPLQEFKDVGIWLAMRESDAIADSMKTGWRDGGTSFIARPGGVLGAPNEAACTTSCEQLRQALVASGRISHRSIVRTPVEGSDLYYDFHTTGTARIDFLRGRVAPHQFEALLNHRFDSLIAHEIRSLLSDSATKVVRDRLFRLGLLDEPGTPTYEALAYLTDTVGALVARYSPYSADSPFVKGPLLYQNPVASYDGFRRLSSGTLRRRRRLIRRTFRRSRSPDGPRRWIRPAGRSGCRRRRTASAASPRWSRTWHTNRVDSAEAAIRTSCTT